MDRKYCVKNGYIVREIAGEFLAVPIDSSCGAHIIILNPVSKFLWELLSQERSFDELLKAVLNEFENVEMDEAASDLKEFLDSLDENGFLI